MLKGKNYCITASNLKAHELIGLKARATQSGKTIEGKVIEETKNVLMLETRDGEKMVPKKGTRFEFEIGEEKAVLNGSEVLYRPEQRLRALWRNEND